MTRIAIGGSKVSADPTADAQLYRAHRKRNARLNHIESVTQRIRGVHLQETPLAVGLELTLGSHQALSRTSWMTPTTVVGCHRHWM